MCVVGTTRARFKCHVKCLQKDCTMIQYWKENLQCLQKGRQTKQQGINLIFVNWIFIRREMIVIHFFLCKKKKKPKCFTPAAQSVVRGPTASPGRLLEMHNFSGSITNPPTQEEARNEFSLNFQMETILDLQFPNCVSKFTCSFVKRQLQETIKPLPPHFDSDSNRTGYHHKNSLAPGRIQIWIKFLTKNVLLMPYF